MRSFNCVSLLIAAIFVTLSVSQSAQGAEKSVKKVWKVLIQLDNFALGKTPLSGLTVRDLLDAHAEYNTWDQKTINDINRNPVAKATLALLKDFLFNQLERFDDLIDERDHEAYVRRLELAYKRFRASYLGHTVGAYMASSKKTDALTNALWGLKGASEVTLKLFKDAKLEYQSYLAKVEEIPEYEDIYAPTVMDEYEKFRNYFAREDVKILGALIFPTLDAVTTDEELEVMKLRFRAEMQKKNYGLYQGRVVQFVAKSQL